MIIALDVDGVVADLYSVWFGLYNEDYDDDLTHARVTSWNVHNFVKPECGQKMYAYLDRPTIYDAVEPISGALEAVRRLRDFGHRVVFVTAAVPMSAGHKYQWLMKHGFLGECQRSDYVEAEDKSLIRADALVDDAPHNLRNFVGRGILISLPHNASAIAYERADSLSAAADILVRK
jgi:5'-nucleotidase